MKSFETPEVEVKCLTVEDVITASSGDVTGETPED